MKGQVLDYSVQTNTGVISGSDGSRYTFVGIEWKGDTAPSRGMSVDFDVQGTAAIGVYKALGLTGFVADSGPKNRIMAGVLALLLGGLGAHKFYLGSWGLGIVYLVFCWTYIPSLVSLVEGIRYLTLTDEQFSQKASGQKGPFTFIW